MGLPHYDLNDFHKLSNGRRIEAADCGGATFERGRVQTIACSCDMRCELVRQSESRRNGAIAAGQCIARS